MAITPQWQAVETLHDALLADERVRGLVLAGSLVSSEAVADRWSDADVVVVVADEAKASFCATTDWLACVGEVYATEATQQGPFFVVRAFLTSGLRVDAVIAPESALAGTSIWPVNSLSYGFRCLFSRSPALDLALTSVPGPSPTAAPDCLDEMARDFRFKAMLAASKAARYDLLVALHLTLDLARDCTVLAMLLRDRELGTDHHRNGNPQDPLLRSLPAPPASFQPSEVLDCIERSVEAFTHLAAKWRSADVFDRQPLVDWIATVRQSLCEG